METQLKELRISNDAKDDVEELRRRMDVEGYLFFKQLLNPDDLLAKKRAIVEEQRKISVPGKIECVCDIVRANYGKIPMAIASSGIKEHVEEGLQENGLLHFFDYVITHEDVSANKPAPDIFLLAAEKLNIPPGNCRGFEDADVGMKALRAAGMDACDVRKMAAYPHKF